MRALIDLKLRDVPLHCLGLLPLLALSLGSLGCGSSSTDGPQGDGDMVTDTIEDTPPIDDVDVEDTEGGDGDESDCERELRFEAVPVGAPAPFDVVIIADHSDSLSWSRDDLASGLAKFLDEVRGHDVRFFVLTPTQYGASSEAASLSLGGSNPVQWQDPATGLAYENAMTDYSQSCVDAAGASMACPTTFEETTPDYELVGNWTLSMPPPIATIRADTSLAALEEQRVAISAAILGLGSGGSSDEQPVCTLHRYLDQDPALLPENAVVLLLSDEDDSSNPRDCVLRQNVECSTRESTEMYLVVSPGLQEQRSFNCTPMDDQGNVVGEPVPQRWYTGINCTTGRACSADDLQTSQDACPANHIMSDCTIQCEEGNAASCLLEKSATVVDACNSPFVLDGTTFDNLLDYCQALYPNMERWDACQTLQSGPSRGCGHSTTPVSGAATMADMATEARVKAENVFGAGGFSIKLIGFDPRFSCEPQAGQSYLSNLKGLVEDESQVFPICEDYSGTLRQVRDFATGLVQSDYPLDLAEGESLEAVRVVSGDGVQRELTAMEYTYDATTGVLRIEKTALSATDQEVALDVGRACIIR